MRLVLSDSDLVDVLIKRLRDLEYSVDRVESDTIEIDVQEPHDEQDPSDQEHLELVFLVRACLNDHPGAAFRVLA